MTGPAKAQQGHVIRIPGLSAVAADYAAVLSDIWGVVHNGVTAFPEACDALIRMRKAGAKVVLISNAPRPHTAIREQLDNLGVPRAAYDGIVTSGDLTQDRLRTHRGEGVFHLGPERDLVIFDGISVELVSPDSASLVVNSGLKDDEHETPDDYRPLLSELASRRIEMICANPDIVVERGDRLVWCAGALAEIYETMGGPVVWAGKPHPPIYERALALVDEAAGQTVPRKRVLAIGDSLRTDLAGAVTMGLDSVFIAEGIHARQTGRGSMIDQAILQEMLDEAGLLPRAVMPRLVW
jgi:HAD superfamily hydrolase (TIGR01459 family)